MCVCVLYRSCCGEHTLHGRHPRGDDRMVAMQSIQSKKFIKKKKFDMSACASNVSMTGFDFSVRMEREPFFFYFILY